jgi:molybdopterin molybdotransferase
MPPTENDAGHGQRRRDADVRLRGFADRASLTDAIGWIDRHSGRLDGDVIALDNAAGRILAAPITAQEDLPRADRAATDGYALRAAETVGAGDYNPLLLASHDGPGALPLGSASLIASGTALPAGANAILPFEAARRSDTTIEIFAAVAEGIGVERRGQHVPAATPLFAPGRALRPQDFGLLALLGFSRVSVVRRPRIRLVIAGAKSDKGGTLTDANGPMLRALIARDGGDVEMAGATPRGRTALGETIAAPGADAVIVAGRTGTGADDEAPLALADMGKLVLHGVALRPGGTLGLGSVGAIPVLLLPGDPLACLCAYDLLAGRLIRGLGGASPEMPYNTREIEIGRKIVSNVGVVDLCRLRLVDGRAEPVGTAESGGLVSATRADGFALVPETLEGYAPGSSVTMYCYDHAPPSRCSITRDP